MDARDRVVVLVDDEMSAIDVLVSLVDDLECGDGERGGSSSFSREVIRGIRQMISYLSYACFDGCYVWPVECLCLC